jgi:hypothetical protein
MSLAEYHDMVEPSSAHGPDEALTDGIQVGSAWLDLHDLNVRALGDGGEAARGLRARATIT